MIKIVNLLAALFPLLGVVNNGASQALNRYEYQHPQMGALFRLVLYATDSERAQEAALAAFAHIDTLNILLSDFLPESELSRLGRQSDSLAIGREEWQRVSSHLEAVLRQAQKIALQTDGAFDITIGPLSKLWRRAFRQRVFPDSLTLEEALNKVGYNKLQIHPIEPKVKLLCPGMRLDLGGIAKGYAVDEAMAVLRQNGLPIALVDGGGDLLAGDPPPGRAGWEVAIGKDTLLTIARQAVATSGDTYRFLVWQGRRYSHIIDPRTGLGATHGLRVTVLAPRCTLADALASALSVDPSLKKRINRIFPEVDIIFRE